MNQVIEIKSINFKKEKQEGSGLAKKIFLGMGILILLFGITQIINAEKYKMVVNVKDGQNLLGINPLNDSLDFGDLSRNNGMTRYVTLNNGGSAPVYIASIEFGDISDLVNIDKKYFTLKPGEETQMSFEINIPPSALTRNYSGSVWIFRLPKLL